MRSLGPPPATTPDPWHRRCPVCDGRQRRRLHTQHLALPDQFDLPQSFDLVCCAGCGMVFSDVSYTGDQIQAYYAADTYEFGNGSGELGDGSGPDPTGEPPSSGPVRDRLAAVARYIADAFPDRSIRILDVGCATGLLLALLRQEGFSRIEGIDPSAAAVRTAGTYGLTARVGSLEALPGDIGRFDLVILSHVLEHVLDPAAVLPGTHELLGPSGQLYVEVPDAARYDQFVVEPFNEINLEHINHFSIAHLDALLGRLGYRTVDTGARDFLLSEGWPYPAVYGRWTPGAPLAPAGSDGGALERSVSRYVAASDALVERVDRFLLEELDPEQDIVVRCLGYRAWTLLGVSALRDFRVVHYVDTHPAKQQWSMRGRPVVGPAADADSEVPVVVLAYQAEAAIRQEYRIAAPGREIVCVGRSRELPPPLAPAAPR